MKKIIIVLSSFFCSYVLAEEIEDLSRAKSCFAMEQNSETLNGEIFSLKQITVKEEKLQLEIKKNIDKYLKKDLDDQGILKDAKKKYQINSKAIAIMREKLSTKQHENLLLYQNSVKAKCMGKFSEEAVEKICIIDKQYSLACNRLLNGEMKHLKE